MHILVLEAYDGGSHGQVLDGLVRHSRHRFTRVSLPARKWKWRMRGSALYFSQRLGGERVVDETGGQREAVLGDIDVVFTSDMTAAADLRSLLPKRLREKPLVVYFHENQLTYPLSDESERDYQYGFTNLTSCLAADAVWFNSRYHLEEFVAGAESLLGKMPDFVPPGLVEAVRRRAVVMSPGLQADLFAGKVESQSCDPPTGDTYPSGGQGGSTGAPPPPPQRASSPTILWNHRWEYDKNPEEFFEVLFALQEAGLGFRVLVAGETFRTAPPIFAEARDRLAGQIDHFGFVRDRRAYLDLLGRANVSVSTAIHEFFGLSVLEAVAAGCYPLLPDRLSYPELIPRELHESHLYHGREDLQRRLERFCREGVPVVSGTLRESVQARAWPRVVEEYDRAFDEVAAGVGA